MLPWSKKFAKIGHALVMNQEFLKTIHRAHFIGIGGIGVSALARLMLARGISVTGSDRTSSPITARLEELGARIFIGHDTKNLPFEAEVVVYSPAIEDNNPELNEARVRNMPTYSYPEALGAISRGMRTIAVSGTHGKTTTTAMIAHALVAAGKSPTVIVGSLLKDTQSNFIEGESDLFVVEACEYKRSFLSLTPEILVITNVDDDHLDYYGTLRGIQGAFIELIAKVPSHGAIVCDPHDPSVAPVIVNAKARIVDYTVEVLGSPLVVLGDHNRKNAQVAHVVARLLGVPAGEAMDALGTFEGVWRRMERKGKLQLGTPVYDDYAHHPTEIQATLAGFRTKYPKNRLRVVFQPHLYSRTKFLLNEFAQSFKDASEVIVMPVYAARETVHSGATSEELVQVMKTRHSNVLTGGDFLSVEEYLRATERHGDVMVTMGAGDVYKIGEDLLRTLH